MSSLDDRVQTLLHRLREFHSAAHLNHLFERCRELAKSECEYVGNDNNYNQFLIEWCLSLYSQLYTTSVERLKAGELNDLDEISVEVTYGMFAKQMQDKYG